MASDNAAGASPSTSPAALPARRRHATAAARSTWASLRAARERCDSLVVSGGLGPDERHDRHRPPDDEQQPDRGHRPLIQLNGSGAGGLVPNDFAMVPGPGYSHLTGGIASVYHRQRNQYSVSLQTSGGTQRTSPSRPMSSPPGRGTRRGKLDLGHQLARQHGPQQQRRGDLPLGDERTLPASRWMARRAPPASPSAAARSSANTPSTRRRTAER